MNTIAFEPGTGVIRGVGNESHVQAWHDQGLEVKEGPVPIGQMDYWKFDGEKFVRLSASEQDEKDKIKRKSALEAGMTQAQAKLDALENMKANTEGSADLKDEIIKAKAEYKALHAKWSELGG